MNKIKILLVAGLFAISSVATAGMSLKDKLAGVMEYSNNVVQVTDDTRAGSGTFISPSHVLTNHHVVKTLDIEGEEVIQQFRVHTPDGKTRVALVVGTDSTQDLALLKVVNYKHDSFARLATAVPDKLGSVWSLGFPSGIPLVITNGTYQYRFTNGADVNCELTTAPIFYGNSGGSTIHFEDGEPRLLGVSASVLTGGYSEYHHVACSISYVEIKKFISRVNPNLALNIF